MARHAELLRFNSWDGDLSTSLEDLVSRVGNLRGDLPDRSFDQFAELVERDRRIAR